MGARWVGRARVRPDVKGRRAGRAARWWWQHSPWWRACWCRRSQAHAASTDVVISEIMFNPASGVDGDEFLELTNPGPRRRPVRLVLQRHHAVLPRRHHDRCRRPAGRLARTPRASRHVRRSRPRVYTGSLSNGGETITLKDATAAVDRHGHLLRPRPVADHHRRHRPVAGADRPDPGQQRPGQLGGFHRRVRQHAGRANSVAGTGLQAAHHRSDGDARTSRRPTRRSRSPPRSPVRRAPSSATRSTSTAEQTVAMTDRRRRHAYTATIPGPPPVT